MLLPFAIVGTSTAVNNEAFAAASLYILIYGVMNLGAFAVVTAVAREAPGALIGDFAGLGRRSPALAVSMMLFLLSLAGIPPLAGFWGKFFIFDAAITGDAAWLAGIMVVNSVVSIYYYVSIVRQMFFVDLPQARPLATPFPVAAVVVLASAAVLAVGIFPDLFATFPPGATLP